MLIMPPSFSKYFRLSLLAGVVFLGGCAVASHAIKSDFTTYNSIIHFNQSQQMLLNLVRLHYRESPSFLQAGSLTASYESTAGADGGITGLSGLNGWAAQAANVATGYADLNYKFSSKPTITYTPIDGKNYVQEFLTEVSPDTFCLLLKSGWPIEKLGNLLIDKVIPEGGGKMINRSDAKSYPKYQAWLKSLQAAQEKDDLDLIAGEQGTEIKAGNQMTALKRINFRSLLDVMFHAAMSTETPSIHRSRIRPNTTNPEIVIHSSFLPPHDASVWVRYAGHYYSINNSDVTSKDTFALLMELYRLQAAPSTGAPVLTIPAR
jgi:hypothetical protein